MDFGFPAVHILVAAVKWLVVKQGNVEFSCTFMVCSQLEAKTHHFFFSESSKFLILYRFQL